MASVRETTCAIADDHEVFRLGLRLLIDSLPGFTVCGEAHNGDEALALSLTRKPDLLILDYAMPGKSGLDVLFELKRHHCRTQVLMLTAIHSGSIVTEMQQGGAAGICLKDEPNDVLVETILAVAAGKPCISLKAAALAASEGKLTRLTPRERQVLARIANGRRNREIAEELNLSPKTVDVHRTNLMRKLDLHSVVAVVEFAAKHGLIDTDRQ